MPRRLDEAGGRTMRSGSRPAICGQLEGQPALRSAVVFLSIGCGVHSWQRLGADVQDFERACMRARGWQRGQVGVPERNRFRGPDEVEQFDNPPSPTAGQGTTFRDAATDAACRQPRATRPAGGVRPHR
jgi:hypothetical protein